MAKPSDHRFVRSSFLAGYRSSHAAGLISMDDWNDVMGAQWDKILTRPGIRVYVAYHPGETDDQYDLYGFLVVDTRYQECPYVVYINVKHKYRRFGVATGLLKFASIDPTKEFHYAAKTGVVSKLRNQIPLAKWKPLAIRFEGSNGKK